MKNLYHLLVTRYKLHVTNLLCRISDIGYRISFVAFCFLPFAAFAQTQEATVTDVVFSCPGIVEITYDLDVCGSVNVTVSYSPDKCTWNPVPGAEGDLGPQTSGTNKKITWNSAANNANFGKLYFKVEYPASDPDPNPNPTPVTINGVKWSPVNLDVGGVFCANPWDYGGLYQWGRVADGHECRTSPCWPLASDCGSSAQGVVSLPLGDQVSCPAAPCGYFIRSDATPYDWRSPQNGNLWNLNENNPIKTANDPCPNGWRVPTRNELNGLFSTIINGSGPLETYNGIAGRWFGAGGVPSLFLPVAGVRVYLNGSFNNVGTYGRYWSSTPTGTDAYSLYFRSGYFDVYNFSRGNGFSVRCVKMN